MSKHIGEQVPGIGTHSSPERQSIIVPVTAHPLPSIQAEGRRLPEQYPSADGCGIHVIDCGREMDGEHEDNQHECQKLHRQFYPVVQEYADSCGDQGQAGQVDPENSAGNKSGNIAAMSCPSRK